MQISTPKRLIVILIFLLLGQWFYSFLFPATGSSDNWLPIVSYLPKFQPGGSDNFILEKVYPLVSSEYRISSDSGNYLELAKDFNREMFRGHIFTARPLYSFLIFLFSLPFRLFLEPSYGLVFGLSIFLNFILTAVAVVFLFRLLGKLFSQKVAFLSSVLLIFSPYVRASLIQPLAEMLMLAAVALVAYFLYDYSKKPSARKLIIYSLILGIFMLGKMFFAVSIFILLLAIYFKRYKEGVLFLIIHLIPFLFWYLWVTQIWQIPYYSAEIKGWDMGVWLLSVFQWPWHKTFGILLGAVPNFIRALVYGFLLIPLVFSVIGFKQWDFKQKNIVCFGSVFSLFSLFFIMNLYSAHHAFLLFPIIYPTCILGIERTAAFLKRYHVRLRPIFYGLAMALIIFISNINIYKVFDWIAQ